MFFWSEFTIGFTVTPCAKVAASLLSKAKNTTKQTKSSGTHRAFTGLPFPVLDPLTWALKSKNLVFITASSSSIHDTWRQTEVKLCGTGATDNRELWQIEVFFFSKSDGWTYDGAFFAPCRHHSSLHRDTLHAYFNTTSDSWGNQAHTFILPLWMLTCKEEKKSAAEQMGWTDKFSFRASWAVSQWVLHQASRVCCVTGRGGIHPSASQ